MQSGIAQQRCAWRFRRLDANPEFRSISERHCWGSWSLRGCWHRLSLTSLASPPFFFHFFLHICTDEILTHRCLFNPILLFQLVDRPTVSGAMGCLKRPSPPISTCFYRTWALLYQMGFSFGGGGFFFFFFCSFLSSHNRLSQIERSLMARLKKEKENMGFLSRPPSLVSFTSPSSQHTCFFFNPNLTSLLPRFPSR